VNKKKSKLFIIVTFILTAGLAASAVFIGLRLSKQQEVTPQPSQADYIFDCNNDNLVCPAGWTPEGGKYCEHPGSNVCKLKCVKAGESPWWMDNGTVCWVEGGTTIQTTSPTTGASTVQATTISGTCDYRDGSSKCYCQNTDNSVCCKGTGGYCHLCNNVHCEFRNFGNRDCPVGQMSACDFDTSWPSGFTCTTNLCSGCTCSNPPTIPGWTRRCAGNSSCVCQDGDREEFFTGICSQCNNIYFCHACYYQQATTIQTTVVTTRVTTRATTVATTIATTIVTTISTTVTSTPTTVATTVLSTTPTTTTTTSLTTSLTTTPTSTSSIESTTSSQTSVLTTIVSTAETTILVTLLSTLPVTGIFDNSINTSLVGIVLVLFGTGLYIVGFWHRLFQKVIIRIVKKDRSFHK
jgi:hypothetical protein